MDPEYLIVIAESDPVASQVAKRWGPLPSTGDHVDGSAIRRLSQHALVLHRPGPHIHDEHLDLRLPAPLQSRHIPLVFPSIHQSESGTPCFTVHPIGNPTASAEVGGTPLTLVPPDARRMAGALRVLAEAGQTLGLAATFEATHHGPALDVPAFFVEIGFGDRSAPPEEAVSALARAIPEIAVDPVDRIAVAVGGGHYAPHFTELVLERHWAVGHILSRHAIVGIPPPVVRQAWEQTEGATGWLFARAADAEEGGWLMLGPRVKDNEAPRRGPGAGPEPERSG